MVLCLFDDSEGSPKNNSQSVFKVRAFGLQQPTGTPVEDSIIVPVPFDTRRSMIADDTVAPLSVRSIVVVSPDVITPGQDNLQ
ncbi:hypothetical protein K0M31_004407 [Melipona bicolor]|uniref:Uncharacterized protein n=1 Tax=Melipona bicolor TaxID=60889 RepID=A0AA40KNB6_9HYME|nr:hypothetical protein K0M31_004407 [Melipona bicolor]